MKLLKYNILKINVKFFLPAVVDISVAVLKVVASVPAVVESATLKI